MKATTIFDVAKAAGVSIATVSKVINNSGKISTTTRKRILEHIKELNYQPNMMASALKGKHTHSLGLLLPDMANPFFAELARSIEDKGHELGYNLIICSTDYNPDKELEYIELLKRKTVDGIILASGFEQIDKVEDLGEDIPIAVTARDFPSSTANTVTIDDYQGGYQATSHLIELGHERIYMIARNVWTNRERLRGYTDALKVNKISYEPDFEFVQESTVEGGRTIMHKYLKSTNPPTAVVACNDLLAGGAIQAVKETGLVVPDDISVVGFDDTIITTLIDPPLTTMALPTKSMGEKIMELMNDEIANNNKERIKIALRPELIVRKTSDQYQT